MRDIYTHHRHSIHNRSIVRHHAIGIASCISFVVTVTWDLASKLSRPLFLFILCPSVSTWIWIRFSLMRLVSAASEMRSALQQFYPLRTEQRTRAQVLGLEG
ncbi:hypothetical protein B0H17DRAFT_1104379 [Mycena rosella]|uniref:Uncharacterized protein n=1 Tax=Mycena rosella TaxID=1033263 RepID=A0AAD7CD79_MYCRO|nr:hypothetical protein B0H17DRAFT_1104379 [Mycena rosella]